MIKHRPSKSPSQDDLSLVLMNADGDSASHRQSPEERVHCARVQSKRLAAALHLYKKIIPRDEYRALRKHLKDASDPLAKRRDLDVIRKRLWSKTRRLKTSEQQEFKQWLDDRIPKRFATQEPLKRANEHLAATLKAWPKPHAIYLPDLFKRGTAEAFRKAKKAFRKARKTSDSSDFHRWRIWTKRLFLQLQLAASLHLDSPAERLKRLDKLQNKLGDLHDLNVAGDFLAGEKRGPKKPLKRLWKCLKRDRATLQRKVIRRAKKLF